jgi:hypothetical protein
MWPTQSLDDMSTTVSKAFNSGATLKALVRYGVTTAGIPRYSAIARRSRKPMPEIALSARLLSQIGNICGNTAIWATSMNHCTIKGIKYACSRTGWSVGNANIGFMTSCGLRCYAVGRIVQILKVRTSRDTSSTRLVFVVTRHVEPPVGFDIHIWRTVLSHPALGIQVVGTEVDPSPEIIPLEDIIGHVAVKLVKGIYGEALVTVQLTASLRIA